MLIKQRLAKLCVLSGVVMASACAPGTVFDPENNDHIDRGLKLSRQDYQHMAAPKQSDAVKGADGEMPLEYEVAKAPPLVPPVPEMAQILAAPRPPELGKTKLVSVTVTDDVPLKDVLIELARLADVDIELGEGIKGGISFRAKDKPFNEVIRRISDLAGLRYNVKNGVLRIERDIPYVKNYPISFLNIIRDSQSEVSLATDVLSSGEGDGGGGLTTGTTSSISSKNESDFWVALETNLSQLLNSLPVPELSPLAEELTAAASRRRDDDAPPTRPRLGGEGEGSSGVGREGAFYVINKQAGILSISASERQHEMVGQYLTLLERSASAQVLIEAKIVEVELEQDYQTGVNWSSALGNSQFSLSFPSTATNGASYALLGPANGGGDNLGIDLDAVVQLTEQFGALRTLSSPRLHAINNQQAVLTFAENRIFFEVDVEREDEQIVDGTVIPGSVTVSSTRRSVPIGIILSILPSIDLENGEVTLSVRPTLSRQISTVQDPGSAILNSTLSEELRFTNEVPVVEVRELDSVMKIDSGSVMVIGGLMEDGSNNVDNGTPFLGEVPWVGNLFKNTVKKNNKRELIIFIKATIVASTGSYDPADKSVYDKFTDDPRPLAF